ncbi:helix-turn-helix domain-containing protein [Streptomyces sp. BI20]|uniref:helix-turn-helix domain-containing protein n=1 Tax=Streptomyces sp. BI20 TaxID=3403460 RepID=UPI003C72F43C
MNKRELTPEVSPAAAFGARLRSLREGRGWKQTELGEQMGYSGAHISAVENGRKIPTRRLAQSGDKVFGLKEPDTLVAAERNLRLGVLLDGFPEYAALEARAIDLRLYQIGIIPGLIQTPAYARTLALASVRRGVIAPELAEERLEFLAQRQSKLVRANLPMLFVVLDESCVRRLVGGREVMAEQLEHLIEFAERPNTVLQIAPFEMGERRAINLPVNLLTMADRSGVAYMEAQNQGFLERESVAVRDLFTAYHQLQAESLSQPDSVAMINAVRKGYQ